MFDLLLARMTYGYLVIYAVPRQRIRSVGLLCGSLSDAIAWVKNLGLFPCDLLFGWAGV